MVISTHVHSPTTMAEETASNASFEEEDASSVDFDHEDDASSSHLVSSSSNDDDDDDDSAVTPPPSSSRLQSSWRKSVRSVETELRGSSHHNNGDNINKTIDDSVHSAASSYSKRLFGGPAEFGGSRHGCLEDGESDQFYHQMMARKKSDSQENENENEDDSSSSSARELLASSPSKLAVEDVTELQDMLVDSDNEELLERSFRKIVSPGHVRANREFYETLQTKPPEPANLDRGEDDQDEGSDQSDDDDDDDYGILKQQDSSKEVISPVADEKTQVMILERRAEKARGDPSNYQSSQEEMASNEIFGQHGDNSGDDDDDDTDNNSGEEDEDEGKSKDSHSNDNKLSNSWIASVADEENDLDRSRRSRGWDDSGTTSFRRQKELMNSSRKSSLRLSEEDMEVSMHSPAKHTIDELREDLESQVKERVRAKDEDTKRELERSLHRVESVSLQDDASKDSSAEIGEEDDEGDRKSKPIDKPPVTTVAQKKGRLTQVGEAMSSMKCIYGLLLCVCLMMVGVIVLAVFFAQAD